MLSMERGAYKSRLRVWRHLDAKEGGTMEQISAALRRYLVHSAFLAVVVVALVTVSGSLAASGMSVSIAPKAYVHNGGYAVETQLTFTCPSGTLLANVDVRLVQTFQNSANGQGATGQSAGFPVETANCDGTVHKLNVTVYADSGTFDIGRATATATLMLPGNTVSATRTVQIVV
jgi:hypothetical protein